LFPEGRLFQPALFSLRSASWPPWLLILLTKLSDQVLFRITREHRNLEFGQSAVPVCPEGDIRHLYVEFHVDLRVTARASATWRFRRWQYRLAATVPGCSE
jgi:hypothetical protein